MFKFAVISTILVCLILTNCVEAELTESDLKAIEKLLEPIKSEVNTIKWIFGIVVAGFFIVLGSAIGGYLIATGRLLGKISDKVETAMIQEKEVKEQAKTVTEQAEVVTTKVEEINQKTEETTDTFDEKIEEINQSRERLKEIVELLNADTRELTVKVNAIMKNMDTPEQPKRELQPEPELATL